MDLLPKGYSVGEYQKYVYEEPPQYDVFRHGVRIARCDVRADAERIVKALDVLDALEARRP